jgi:hypothetical protein
MNIKDNKKIIIGIIALAFIIVLTVFIYHSQKGSIQNQESTSTDNVATTTDITQTDHGSQGSTTSLIAPTIDFNNPKTLAFARSIPKDPSVIHIRKVFNEYLSGAYGKTNDDGVFDIPPSDYAQGGMVGGFDSFDKSIYQSRFIINAVNSNVTGGEDYDIIFLDHPEHVYIAWIYMEGEGTGTPSFRTFWLNTGYPANYGEELLRLNPRLKTDTTLSI